MTAPTIAERIAEYLGNGGLWNPEAMEHDKVRTLLIDCRDYLQSIESQTVPVEPDVVKRIRIAGQSDTLLSVIEYIDALKAKLQAAQQELLDTTWQDHADHWKKRAEQAEKDRDICYISLQDMRRRLHEIASLVTDPRLDEKHTA